jgi:hypothetical protein
VGWISARTLGSLALVALLFGAFVLREQRTAAPLIRLGIFRNSGLVRANLGVMALAAWVGFQFIATLYMQQLRGWSALASVVGAPPSVSELRISRSAIVRLSSRDSDEPL